VKKGFFLKMCKIKILLISFCIIVAFIDKTQINGETLRSNSHVEVKRIRLRTFTPLKDLRTMTKHYGVEQKLQEEKEAEEERRQRNAKVMEEQMRKSRTIQKYLNSHRFERQSFHRDFHTNRSF